MGSKDLFRLADGKKYHRERRYCLKYNECSDRIPKKGCKTSQPLMEQVQSDDLLREWLGKQSEE